MCLLLALAIVFSPPSAAHAQSGLHAGHLATVSHEKSGHNHGAHGAASAGDLAAYATPSEKSPSDDGSGQCCNGLCLVALIEAEEPAYFNRLPSEQYTAANPQMIANDPVDFQRPPRKLI